MTATTDPNTIPCPRCFGARQVEMLIQPMVGACYIGPVRCPACSGSGRDEAAHEARANAAQRGPWRPDIIAHARTDIPALIAEVRRLRAALA